MSVVAFSVLSLFALVFLGFAAGKTKVVNQESIPDFSNLVIKVAMPATIFLSIYEKQGSGLLGDNIIIFPIIFLFHVLSLFAGIAATKIFNVDEKDKGVWYYAAMFSNNGFMGFPLAYAVFGDEGLFMMAMANIVLNVLIFSIGTKFLTKGYEADTKINLRKMFVNNVNIAIVIGLLFYFANIPIPDILGDILTYVGNITSGLSMIVVGLSLSRINVKNVFEDRKMFILAVVRLIVSPLIVVAFFRLIPIETSSVLEGIALMCFALPAPATASMITEQYHTNTTAAARAVFITTLFSAVTVPIMMMLL